MLRLLENLPVGLIGVSASGEVTKEDYESVLLPLFKKHQTEKIRFIYRFEESFKGLTPGAAWDDFRIGFKYLKSLEACAVVNDIEWINSAVTLVGSFLPCPVRTFALKEYKAAKQWLVSFPSHSQLDAELSGDGVLVLTPHGPLSREDFNKLERMVDPWIKGHKKLNGVVINTHRFPGWKNVGSFIRHVKFLKDHKEDVRKVAIAVDGPMPAIMSKVAPFLAHAKFRHFASDKIDEAVVWAKAPNVG